MEFILFLYIFEIFQIKKKILNVKHIELKKKRLKIPLLPYGIETKCLSVSMNYF